MKPPSALLYLALAALVLPLGSTPAHASDTRRHGLAGNLGFEDDTDVHTFPQLASRWGNRAGFDLGSGGSDLRGGIVVGEGTAFGLFVHRPTTGDWFAPFDDGSIFLRRFEALPGIAPPSGTTLEPPLPLAGLVVAFPNGFGLGLKIANSMDQRLVRIEEEGEAGAEPRLVDAEEGAQSTSVVVGGGWSSRRSDRAIDLGGHLAFHRFKTVTEGKIRAESSLTPSFDLTGRYFVRRSTTWSWIGLAQLDWRNYQLDLPFFDNLVEETALSLRAAAGPQIDLGTRAQVVG
ncbi:MAG: hypothetical protein RBU45_15465, partial [Myxococcota bacterium]|nr:hypothetical protein [Myxococcota bacterium]